ncbi:MAG: hypothetical protein ACXVD9_12670 [Actinomycetota bacterium]
MDPSGRATEFELVMSSPEAARADSGRARHMATAGALISIWISIGLISLFAPDMITGSQHEHLPIAAILGWSFAAIASAFVLMASAMSGRAGEGTASLWWSFAAGVGGIWLVIMLAGIFSPEMVTGTDPTRIPIAAMGGPVVGSIVTAFASMWVLGARRAS